MELSEFCQNLDVSRYYLVSRCVWIHQISDNFRGMEGSSMFPENNLSNFLEMFKRLATKVVGFIFWGVRWLDICGCIVQVYGCGRCDTTILSNCSGIMLAFIYLCSVSIKFWCNYTYWGVLCMYRSFTVVVYFFWTLFPDFNYLKWCAD